MRPGRRGGVADASRPSRSRSSSRRTPSCGAPSTTPARPDRAATTAAPGRRAGPRGLARSREHAAELVAAGRVKVSGAVAPSRRPGSRPTSRSWWPTTPTDPTTSRAAGHKLAGALDVFEPAGLVVARSPLPGRRRLDRRVHRRPAAPRGARGGGGGRRLRPAGLVAAERRPGARARPAERARADARADRRSRSTWWSATCRSSRSTLVLDALVGVDRARRRPGADGQAAVRGRQGPGRQGRGRARPGLRAEAVETSPAAAARRGWGARVVARSPLPGPVGQRRVLPVAAPRAGRDRPSDESMTAVHGADAPGGAG